jgi:putative transposase
MPEHVHLLVWPAASALSISGILWSIKQPVAKRAIHHYEKVASEWVSHLTVRLGDGLIERRFWLESGGLIRLLPEPKTIHAVIDEIHHNPVRRGLVATPSEWKWSSAGWYEGRRPVELEIDPTVPAV